MSLGHAKRSLAIGATLILFAAGVACAQEAGGSAALPDSSYGNNANNYQSSTDLPIPAPDDLTSINSRERCARPVSKRACA
jgi:hypothetical protein